MLQLSNHTTDGVSDGSSLTPGDLDDVRGSDYKQGDGVYYKNPGNTAPGADGQNLVLTEPGKTNAEGKLAAESEVAGSGPGVTTAGGVQDTLNESTGSNGKAFEETHYRVGDKMQKRVDKVASDKGYKPK